MIERLGNVLYWTGNIFAALLVLAGATMAVVMIRTDNPTDVASAPYVGAGIALSALIPWLIGRAFRYVLAGRF
jgi:hypothetical protein